MSPDLEYEDNYRHKLAIYILVSTYVALLITNGKPLFLLLNAIRLANSGWHRYNIFNTISMHVDSILIMCIHCVFNLLTAYLDYLV